MRFRVRIFNVLLIFWLVLSLVFTLIPLPVFGTVIKSDGFESGDFSAWDGVLGSPAVVSSTAYNGTYCMEANATGEEVNEVVTATNPAYLGFWVQFNALPADSSYQDVYFCRLLSDGSGSPYVGMKQTGGSTTYLRLYEIDGSYTDYNWEGNLGISNETWTWLEFGVYSHASDGFQKIWLNNTLVIDLTGLNTSSFGNVDNYRFGAYNLDHTNSIHIDDVVFSNSYIEYPVDDTTAPTYSGLSTSTTVAGASCNFNATFTDDTALQSNGQYLFGTNNTGAWVWESAENFTSTPQSVGVTKTLNDTVSQVVGYQWNITDDAGNSNATGIQTIVLTDVDVTLTINEPRPEYYVTGTIPVNMTATGGTIDSYWFNVQNDTSWIYPANQTYSTPTTITGFIDGSNYTFYGWANNTDGTEGEETIVFRVDLDGIKADGGTASEIQDALDLADSGDCVYIPSGTYNFTESSDYPQVDITAGVNLIGGVTERDADDQVVEWTTVLVLPVETDENFTSLFKCVGSSNSSEFTRFSDIMIQGYRSTNSSSGSMTNGLFLEDLVDFRVDHCRFEHACNNGIYINNCSGLIDHNDLVNPAGGVPAGWADRTVVYGVRVGGYDENWDDVEDVLGNYTHYTVFIEDNYFEKWRHCVASNIWAHYVFRYNTINASYAYGDIDVHGSDPPARGVEIYNNTVIDAISGGSVYGTMIRAGCGVAFNNSVGGGVYSQFIYFTNEHADSTYWINDWYIWDNTMLDSCNEVTKYDPLGNIIEDTNYFLRAPNATLDGWSYTAYEYPHPLQAQEQTTYYYLNITSVTGGYTDVGSGIHAYASGTNVSVTATAYGGYSFSDWELDGVDNGTSNPNYVYMDSNHTLIPSFEVSAPTYYYLTISSSAYGSFSPSAGVHGYADGTNVSVTATALGGYHFSSWTLDGADGGSSNPITIEMDENHTLSATFGANPAGGGIDTSHQSPLFIYFSENNFLGFVLACYTSTVGSVFYAIVVFFITSVIYIRQRSLFTVSLIWLLLGGVFIGLFWEFSAVAVWFTLMGIAGIFIEFILVWRRGH